MMDKLALVEDETNSTSTGGSSQRYDDNATQRSTSAQNIENGTTSSTSYELSKQNSHDLIHQACVSNISFTEFEGILSKWTNYVNGWQDRYFVLKEGGFSYCKNRQDVDQGYRGGLNVAKATINAHEFDPCRFDVSVGETTWYIRATSEDERQKWIDMLEAHKAAVELNNDENMPSSLNRSLRRTGSPSLMSLHSIASAGSISLQSTSISAAVAENSSQALLRDKIHEIGTFRDILSKQTRRIESFIDSLSVLSHGAQRHLDDEGDATSAADEDESIDGSRKNVQLNGEMDPDTPIDFKGETLTFKATSQAMLESLNFCVDLLAQKEEKMKKRIDAEKNRRKKLEEAYNNLIERFKAEQQRKLEQKQQNIFESPDFAEGPHSAITEEEFFDAVEIALDREEQELETQERQHSQIKHDLAQIDSKWHWLLTDVDTHTHEQYKYALSGLNDGDWHLFHQDGEMKMYKREVIEDGLVCDPLKSVHKVNFVTAYELCHFFYHPDYRLDWEITVESCKVIKELPNHTTIFHQIHKSVWPASQRDSLFWSHLRKWKDLSLRLDADDEVVAAPPSSVSSSNTKNNTKNKLQLIDSWIVCNRSVELPEIPAVHPDSPYVRVFLTVCYVCQTYVPASYKLPKNLKDIPRDKLTTKMSYCSVVNPGGWAPVSVYKREYPRFLKRFTQYVYDKVQAQKPSFAPAAS